MNQRDNTLISLIHSMSSFGKIEATTKSKDKNKLHIRPQYQSRVLGFSLTSLINIKK